MKKSVIDAKGVLTVEGAEEILSVASVFDCECPKHLIAMIKQVRNFTAYQKNCIKLHPKDIVTHEWLLAKSFELDAHFSEIILKLSRTENMIDENYHVITPTTS